MNGKCKKIFILGVLFLFLYSCYIEPNRLIVRELNLNIPNWDKSLNGMKVVLVGDLHVGTRNVPLKRVERIVNLVNKQNPDIILLLGDLDSKAIVYSKIPCSEVSKQLANLHSNYGTYAIRGNHDYFPSGIISPIYKNANIPLLENESAYFIFNDKKVRVCGIEDIWHERVHPETVLGEVKEPTIFLSHNPDIFPQVPSKVALTVSGHNHGGEIYFPLLGAPFVPSAYGQKYVKGYVVENDKHLFVTSGIACLSHFRLFNPPEIVVLKLYST